MRKEEIEELIQLVESSTIEELEVWEGKRKIRMTKNFLTRGHYIEPIGANASGPQRSGQESSLQEPKSPGSGDLASNLKQISSPMVGTVYRAPAPGSDHFIEVGQTVSVGQTVCIVEAMKLMNEIGSDYKGVVRKVLVDNAQPVEYGQPLFLVEEK